MKVTVVRSGGVAGMVLTAEVDDAELDEATSAQLQGLVEGCELAGDPGGPPGAAADGFAYEVAVQRDDGVVERARFGQGAAPPGAGELVSWVLEGPHAHRRTGR